MSKMVDTPFGSAALSLEHELDEQIEELKRKIAEASRAQAQAAYEEERDTPESDRVHAMDGIELAMQSIRESEPAS